MEAQGGKGSRLLLAATLGLTMLLSGGCRPSVRKVPVVQAPEAVSRSAEARKTRDRKIELSPGNVITAPVVDLSRDEAVALALGHNRDLRVRRLNPAIATEGIKAAWATFDPAVASEAVLRGTPGSSTSGTDDVLTVDAEVSTLLKNGASVSLDGTVQNSRETGGGRDGGWGLSVSQPLQRGGGQRFNLVGVRLAENAYTRSIHQFRDYLISLVAAVESAYLDLILAREISEIRDFALQLAKEQQELTLSMIKLGRLAPDDQASADADVALRKADRISAMMTVHRRSIALMELLSPDAYDPLRTSVDAKVPPLETNKRVKFNECVERAMKNRPDLAQARLDIERRQLEIVRTKDGILPRLDAFASYRQPSTLGPSDDENFSVGLRFAVSLTRRAERSAHRQATYQEEQAREALANLERVVGSVVRQRAVDAEERRRRLPAIEHLVEARKKELAVERDRFRVGKSTSLDVLRVQEKLIEARLDLTETKIGLLQALTNLYEQEGTLLDRRGINLDY